MPPGGKMNSDNNPNENIPNVLVVDDEFTSRSLLKSILEKEGFVVSTAVNGREGRQMAENKQPDLIIMDIQMPEEDGLTACTALKANIRTASIPVLFISAIEDVNSKVEGFDVGGVDYITKPFQVQEVVARVRLQIRLFQSYRSIVAAGLEQLKNLSDSQKGILVQPAQYPEAHFSVMYLAAQAAGGDFYDVIHTGAGIYDYLVADVSGHTTGTALPTAALKALLRQNASMLYSPKENLNLVNQHIRPVLQENQYATLIYARFNKKRMRVTLVNAGHPSAIIYKPSQGAEVVPQSGDGLGLFENITMDTREIQVAAGDRVFIFSDGLIENDINGPIARRVGMANLISLIDELAGFDLDSQIQIIQQRLFPDPLRLDDDAVLLGFEVT